MAVRHGSTSTDATHCALATEDVRGNCILGWIIRTHANRAATDYPYKALVLAKAPKRARSRMQLAQDETRKDDRQLMETTAGEYHANHRYALEYMYNTHACIPI